MRWQHPTRGLVPPGDFIPFAEQTGYIRAITQWVLAQAIAQCAPWRGDGLRDERVDQHLGARPAWTASCPTASRRCWPSTGARRALDHAGDHRERDPRRSRPRASQNLERLHALGCRIAIDDYGTGYSSLAYLRRLPVHELKIDKSFVMGMATTRATR